MHYYLPDSGFEDRALRTYVLYIIIRILLDAVNNFFLKILLKEKAAPHEESPSLISLDSHYPTMLQNEDLNSVIKQSEKVRLIRRRIFQFNPGKQACEKLTFHFSDMGENPQDIFGQKKERAHYEQDIWVCTGVHLGAVSRPTDSSFSGSWGGGAGQL